jgi:hypothetical protein
MIKFFILEGPERRVVQARDAMEWARWFDQNDRSVAQTRIGEIKISTVFLGVDHRFFSKGPPVVFETMAFDLRTGECLESLEFGRYASWDDAVVGHAMAVKRVEQRLENAKRMMDRITTKNSSG